MVATCSPVGAFRPMDSPVPILSWSRVFPNSSGCPAGHYLITFQASEVRTNPALSHALSHILLGVRRRCVAGRGPVCRPISLWILSAASARSSSREPLYWRPGRVNSPRRAALLRGLRLNGIASRNGVTTTSYRRGGGCMRTADAPPSRSGPQRFNGV